MRHVITLLAFLLMGAIHSEASAADEKSDLFPASLFSLSLSTTQLPALPSSPQLKTVVIHKIDVSTTRPLESIFNWQFLMPARGDLIDDRR